MLRNMSEPLDLLLTDVIMPDMNGKELYEQVVHDFPDIKVLFISGYAENIVTSYGILHDGVDFIQKPCSVHELCSKVRAVLDRGVVQGD